MPVLIIVPKNPESNFFSAKRIFGCQPPFNSIFCFQSIARDCMRFTDPLRPNEFFDIGCDHEGRTNLLTDILMRLPNTELILYQKTENEEPSQSRDRKKILRSVLKEYYRDVFQGRDHVSRIYKARQVLAERISFFGIHHSREPIYLECTPKEIMDTHLLFRDLWQRLLIVWQEDLIRGNLQGGRW